MAESEKETEKDSRNDVHDTRVADEEYARLITITDSPADEVGVRLTAQASFDHVFDGSERRGMRRMFEGKESSGAVFTRKIELPARARNEIVRDDPIDLNAERLDSCCESLAWIFQLGGGDLYMSCASESSAHRRLRSNRHDTMWYW